MSMIHMYEYIVAFNRTVVKCICRSQLRLYKVVELSSYVNSLAYQHDILFEKMNPTCRTSFLLTSSHISVVGNKYILIYHGTTHLQYILYI